MFWRKWNQGLRKKTITWYRQDNECVCFQLASFRGRYRTMGDEDQSAQDGFILGFSNPVADSSVGSSGDTIDGKVTVLGYRPLGEDSDGYKGNSVHFYLAFLSKFDVINSVEKNKAFMSALKTASSRATRPRTTWHFCSWSEARINKEDQTCSNFFQVTVFLKACSHGIVWHSARFSGQAGLGRLVYELNGI